MNIEQLSKISKEDLVRELYREQERVYLAHENCIKGLERRLDRYEKAKRILAQVRLSPDEAKHYIRVFSSNTFNGDSLEGRDKSVYDSLKLVEPIIDEEFPERADALEVKKFIYVLKLYAKSLQVEHLKPVWKHQIEKFKRLTPSDMEIQEPTLKVLSKWGHDPGKDTSRFYGREIAGVLWSPFIFRRHIPKKFRANLRHSENLLFGNATTVVTGLLKLGKNNTWFALDSQLFSNKPTPDERWKDMYNRLDYYYYVEFPDYAKVGYYYTKRDELAFIKGATKEELIAESEKILAMTRDEALYLAQKEYKDTDEFGDYHTSSVFDGDRKDEFDGRKPLKAPLPSGEVDCEFGRPKSFDSEFGGDVATFSAFGPKE